MDSTTTHRCERVLVDLAVDEHFCGYLEVRQGEHVVNVDRGVATGATSACRAAEPLTRDGERKFTRVADASGAGIGGVHPVAGITQGQA